MRAFLAGAEVGAAVCALAALALGRYDAALANIAIAAYCRYARGNA